MNIIKAPEAHEDSIRIFLAGSIEMGKATQWQKEIAKDLEDLDKAITLFNPRRDDWDSSWEQKIDNPQFNEQVTWELDGLDLADIIVVNFDPTTMSPITLLELGLYADSGKLLVCCPEGFWRKGNVDIMCRRHQVPMYKTLDELIKELRIMIIDMDK